MKKILILMVLCIPFIYAQTSKEMTVYKTPSCSCCENWIKSMQENGLKVTTIIKSNLQKLKRKHGVSVENSSCHTALIDGYVIEGHVNYSAIKKLLKQKPKNIKGLTVPGMPIGSPGMEFGNKKDPYNILAIKQDGSTIIYEKH